MRTLPFAVSPAQRAYLSSRPGELPLAGPGDLMSTADLGQDVREGCKDVVLSHKAGQM
ncbi:MAG TPA: hypothetical protein VH916_05355 [Dehalococcoidia bacterium]